MASSFITLRFVTLGAATVFSIAELAISAHLFFVISDPFYGIYDIGALGIAVGGFTVVTVVPLLLTSLLCQGAVPNFVFFEFICFSFLSVVWFASAIVFAIWDRFIPANCSFIFDTGIHTFSCREYIVRDVLTWFNWIIFFGYSVFLLTMSIIQQGRGNPVWGKAVTKVDLFAPRGAALAATSEQRPSGYPPQQQYLMYALQPLQQQPVQVVYTPATPTANDVTTLPPQQIVYTPAMPTTYVTTAPPQQIPPPAEQTQVR